MNGNRDSGALVATTEKRYAFVARALTEAIADGRHPVGSVLPTEFELAEQFAVSRSTVRAAMQELQASGLVSRKRNAGTRVEAAAPARSGDGFTQALNTIEAVQQFGTETERHVQRVTDVVADSELATQLGCRPGRRWLCISSLRMIPGDATRTPICWTDVYIDPEYEDVAQAAKENPDTLISALIEARYGRCIDEIQQDVRAIAVSAEMARRLRVEAGTAALEIVRRYLDASGATFEISVTVHPAERFSVSMRLKRSPG